MELEVLIAQTNNKSKIITFLRGCQYCIIMHISVWVQYKCKICCPKSAKKKFLFLRDNAGLRAAESILKFRIDNAVTRGIVHSVSV